MFSRSQAKNFFVIGTAICTIAFIGLTIDTFRQIPKISKAEEMNESVIRGKHLWDVNNCMGCHTLMGEGGYYAPELTLVYKRRGPEFIKAMLKNPEAMYPGERKMQTYKLTEEEMNDLVNFFKWIGEIDLQGFPPQNFIMKVAVPQNDKAVAQPIVQPKIFNQMCLACHAVGGQGGQVGPALDSIGDRKTRDELVVWLRDPQKVKPGTAMPKMPLSEADITELAAYLTLLKTSNERTE